VKSPTTLATLFSILLLSACGARSESSRAPTNTGGSDEGGAGGGSMAGRGGAGGGGTGGSGAGGTGGRGAGGGSGGTGGTGAGGGGSGGTGGAGNSDGGADGSVPDGPPITGSCAKYLGGPGAKSAWVSVGPDGKLVYKTINASGDRIMDFSHAGYRGGGVALPVVPMGEMIGPSGGPDDAPAIQAALNAVAAKPLVSGVRGAVVLKPGTYNLGATLSINASGVVLRGSGSGTGGTEIKLTGMPHDLFAIRGSGSWAVGPETTFTDA